MVLPGQKRSERDSASTRLDEQRGLAVSDMLESERGGINANGEQRMTTQAMEKTVMNEIDALIETRAAFGNADAVADAVFDLLNREQLDEMAKAGIKSRYFDIRHRVRLDIAASVSANPSRVTAAGEMTAMRFRALDWMIGAKKLRDCSTEDVREERERDRAKMTGYRRNVRFYDAVLSACEAKGVTDKVGKAIDDDEADAMLKAVQ